jgi:galactan 5-O-arabinofuranosyltransferase
VVLVASLPGLAFFWVDARVSALGPTSVLTRAELNGLALLVVLGLAAAWALWGRGRPRLLSDLTVAATATYACGSLLLALSGTPWGLGGLGSDEAFQAQGATRFQHALGSADFVYRGLPSHYPPLLAWLEGHAAVLAGRPAWQLVKVGEIALAFLVPVLAYLLWRRVVDARRAAALVAVTTFVTADPHKPNEWLVLALLVPWWLDAFRGCRASDARPWPAWLHGVVAGLLLTAFTFYFVPVAVATVLGLAVDVVRGRPWRAAAVRYLVIVGCALLVSAWYWLPLFLTRLRGLPTDTLQLRWFKERLAGVPLLPGGAMTDLLVLAGVVYLVALAPRRRRAEGVLLVALGAYLVIGAGLVSAALHHPVLAFKADPLALQVLLVGGVLAIFEVSGFAGRFWSARSGLLDRAVLALLAVSALAGMLHFVDTWASGAAVDAAHATPLPDGSLPGGAQAPGARAPVVEMRAALGEAASPSSVVVTSVPGLYATTPVHLFTPNASVYSNPFGQFDRRVAFLRRLAGTADPHRFTAIARRNRFDSIDGFVLRRRGNVYRYAVHVDNYPHAWRTVVVRFHRSQFAASDWRVTELEGAVVVTAR